MVRALAFALALAVAAAPRQPSDWDVLIVGGEVVDGSGAPPRRADVAIRHGSIEAVGTFGTRRAARVIDARGLTVAPGFIDVHTHADGIADRPLAENFARMGVTTVVAGNCGTSALDVGEALQQVERTGISINFATLIGHNTVRAAVMGSSDRLPSLREMARMRSFVWRGMADGAVGFSTGLEYVPGRYARPPEIIELARIAGNAGGVYATHLRNEGTELEKAVQEAIQVAVTAPARLQISHLKVDSPGNWGASARALALVDAARTRRVDVMADQYAYTAASSTLSIRFPGWALAGGPDAAAARLRDDTQWERIRGEMRALLSARGLPDLAFAVVASYPADPSMNGLSMKQVATKMTGSDSPDAQLEAAREMLLRGGASMVYHLMSDEDVERIMRSPVVGLASDSGVLAQGEGVPHPRGYGNAARVLGEYVRARRVITLAEAIRKMTSLPARHFRLERRGQIEKGYAADLVVFDAAAVRETATFERPHAYPVGIRDVLVNGVPVVRGGEHTRERPGHALYHGRAAR